MAAMEFNAGADVNVTDTIAVSHAERFIVLHIFGNPGQSPTGHRLNTGIDQGYVPGFGALLVHFHPVAAHVEGDVGHVQEVVGEVLLDDITLVAAANDEIVDAVMRVHLQDMPKDRHTTDLHHRLGPRGSFFAQARTESTGKDDGFQLDDLW